MREAKGITLPLPFTHYHCWLDDPVQICLTVGARMAAVTVSGCVRARGRECACKPGRGCLPGVRNLRWHVLPFHRNPALPLPTRQVLLVRVLVLVISYVGLVLAFLVSRISTCTSATRNLALPLPTRQVCVCARQVLVACSCPRVS